MSDTTRTPGGEHQRLQELLPWYINDSLDETETLELTEHLESCAECRDEAVRIERMAHAVELADEPAGGMEESLARLNARISAEDGARGKAGIAGRAHRLWADLRAAPMAWRVGFLVPTALAAMLMTALIWTYPIPPSDPLTSPPGDASSTRPEFTVLADAQPGETRYWVSFRSDATMGEVGPWLQEIGARIVAGPTAQGVYTVAVASLDDAAGADELAESLRDSKLVTAAHVASP